MNKTHLIPPIHLMQSFLAIVASSFLGFSSVSLPVVIDQTEHLPHNHVTESIYIHGYEVLPGTENGYCGPFAVTVAERLLGNKTGEPTLDEWLATSTELNIDLLTGGISVESLVSYYEVRDFNIEVVPVVEGNCGAQYFAAERLDGHKCAVFLLMANRSGGHVEAVVGSEQCVLHTNSWGKEARISLDNGFHHTNMPVFNTPDTESFLLIACPK